MDEDANTCVISTESFEQEGEVGLPKIEPVNSSELEEECEIFQEYVDQPNVTQDATSPQRNINPPVRRSTRERKLRTFFTA